MDTPQTDRPNRNDPCSCGSGKKFKRCHGAEATPKNDIPKFGVATADIPGMNANPFARMAKDRGMPDLEGMDPQMLMQMAQAVQKLPRGQLQGLQSLMQRAMKGEDISQEAQALEQTLPPDFQEMARGFQMTPEMAQKAAAAMGQDMPDFSTEQMSDQMSEMMTAMNSPEFMGANASDGETGMTPEQARAIVAQAAAAGKISQEQAQQLTQGSESVETKKGLGKLWQNLKGK